MNNSKLTEKWTENAIIIDGDYVDSVAFNLIVNFERIIGRHIPEADLAHWLDCIALDGGLKGQETETSVIFIHDNDKEGLKNFRPSSYKDELNGKAFKDNLGEFQMSSFPVEKVVSKDDFIIDIVKTAANHKDVKRVMIVANCDDGTMVDYLRQALRDVDDDKRITVFAMQPLAGGNFRQEILGYSLMSALGIKSEEINTQ